jgi:hypothetical protein
MVVQDISLVLLAFMYLLLNEFCCKYILNLCEQLNIICIMNEHDTIIYSYIYPYCDCELLLYVLVCELMYVLLYDL